MSINNLKEIVDFSKYNNTYSDFDAVQELLGNLNFTKYRFKNNKPSLFENTILNGGGSKIIPLDHYGDSNDLTGGAVDPQTGQFIPDDVATAQILANPSLQSNPQMIDLPSQQMDPRQQMMGMPPQMMDPSQQMMGMSPQIPPQIDPRQQMIDPRQQMIDPRQQMMDPRQQMIDPRQQMMDPSQQMMDPSQQMMDPSQQMMGMPPQMDQLGLPPQYFSTMKSSFPEKYLPRPDFVTGDIQTYTIQKGTILYHSISNKRGFNTENIQLGQDRLIMFFTPNFRLASDQIEGCSIDKQKGYIHAFEVTQDIPNIYIKLPYDTDEDMSLASLHSQFCAGSKTYNGVGFFYPKNEIELFNSAVLKSSPIPASISSENFYSEFGLCNPTPYLKYLYTQKCQSLRKLSQPYRFDNIN